MDIALTLDDAVVGVHDPRSVFDTACGWLDLLTPDTSGAASSGTAALPPNTSSYAQPDSQLDGDLLASALCAALSEPVLQAQATNPLLYSPVSSLSPADSASLGPLSSSCSLPASSSLSFRASSLLQSPPTDTSTGSQHKHSQRWVAAAAQGRSGSLPAGWAAAAAPNTGSEAAAAAAPAVAVPLGRFHCMPLPPPAHRTKRRAVRASRNATQLTQAPPSPLQHPRKRQHTQQLASTQHQALTQQQTDMELDLFVAGNDPLAPGWDQGLQLPQQGYSRTQQQGYSLPQQGYSHTQQGYSLPQQGCSHTQQGYSLPQQGYSHTQQGYSLPQQGCSHTQQGYCLPKQDYSHTQQGYSLPQQGYSLPQQGYNLPQQGYSLPQPSSTAKQAQGPPASSAGHAALLEELLSELQEEGAEGLLLQGDDAPLLPATMQPQHQQQLPQFQLQQQQQPWQQLAAAAAVPSRDSLAAPPTTATQTATAANLLRQGRQQQQQGLMPQQQAQQQQQQQQQQLSLSQQQAVMLQRLQGALRRCATRQSTAGPQLVADHGVWHAGGQGTDFLGL